MKEGWKAPRRWMHIPRRWGLNIQLKNLHKLRHFGANKGAKVVRKVVRSQKSSKNGGFSEPKKTRKAPNLGAFQVGRGDWI